MAGKRIKVKTELLFRSLKNSATEGRVFLFRVNSLVKQAHLRISFEA
jgi:hypothetical protein